MEVGYSADQDFCFGAESNRGIDLMGDGGLEGLAGGARPTCCLGSAACREAHVGAGEESCLEMGDGVEALASTQRDFCNVGCEFQSLASPRISFSCDFSMEDRDTATPDAIQSLSRLSPEKRKWDQQDDGSADFEFLRYMPTHMDGAEDPSDGFMLSADELFSNGKLLPIPLCKGLASRDDFYLPSTCEQHRGDESAKLSIYKSTRPITRHLSFELSRPHSTTSHVVFSCTSSLSRASEADSSSCTAPVLLASTPTPTSSPSSPVPSSLLTASSSASPKYSAKFKEIFNLKKVLVDPSSSDLSRDDSFAPSCRLPISPRSFWPFARSSSPLRNNKSSTVCRPETETASLNSMHSGNVDIGKGAKPYSNTMSEPSKIEGKIVDTSEKKPTVSEVASTREASCTENFKQSPAQSHASLNNAADAHRERNASMVASKVRESLSPFEGLVKKTSATSGFARGSPLGRRGVQRRSC